MVEIVLMVFFNINGQWVSHPDFGPLPVDSMLVCQERLSVAQEYFDTLEDFPEFQLGCYRKMVGSPT